jgi:integrase
MPEWIKAKHPGLRYREHESRSTGVSKSKRPLRYLVMTYKWEGKTISEALGWEGDFVQNEDEAYKIFLELKQNRKNRTPPFTLKERNESKEAILAAARQQKQADLIRNTSFEKVFSKFLIYSQQNKRSEKSWKREEQLTRIHILPVFKDLPLGKIAPIQLERLKKNMAEGGLTPRTVRYALAVVRQVFNYAIREGLFSGLNPAAGGKVARPQEDNRKTRYLSRDEASQLLSELAKRSQEVHDMSMLSLFTGMRFGEVANLKWSDLDLSQGIIMLRNTKSGKNRAAYMTPDIKKMFTQRGVREPDKLVFPARGKPAKPGSSVLPEKPHAMISHVYYEVVGQMFNQEVADKKMWVNFHTLRHTFASWLMEDDTNIYFVKELLGHSDLKLTERYAHIGENQLKQAVMKLQIG